MADANRIRVSIVPETTFGVTPNPASWLVLATTGQSMRDRVGYQQSRTINNDRNVQDLVRLSKSAGGQIPMELTYSPVGEGLMRLIMAALSGTESAALTTANVDTIAASNFLTIPSGTWAALGYETGDIILVPTGVDAGYYRIISTSLASTSVQVETTVVFTGSTGNTVKRGARIKNGTTNYSFSIEVARLDIGVSVIYKGCSVNTMSLVVADEQITTCNFAIEGTTSTSYDAETSPGSGKFQSASDTYTNPTVSPVLDALGVPTIRRGGVDYAAKQIQMDLSNNVAARTVIGSLGAQSIRYGEYGATGRVDAYLEDLTDIKSYRDNVATDLWLALIDPNGKGYTISFPQVKFSEAGADTRGSNQDDLNQMAVTAIKDPDELVTVRLQRWD